MGTTSMIWLKVRKEDYGKVMKADVSKLPNPVVDMHYDIEPVTIPDKIEDLYLGVYCNFDGYHSGVGAELAKKFKTYEQVLNLILLGELSYMIEEIRSYHCWRNETPTIWKSEGKPKSTQDYYYCFDEDYINGQDKSYENDFFYSGTHWSIGRGYSQPIRLN